MDAKNIKKIYLIVLVAISLSCLIDIGMVLGSKAILSKWSVITDFILAILIYIGYIPMRKYYKW